MMDNSPTTGSVNATAAEKLRLAKASLAFNCRNPTFRKLFPEYVDKYNKQQQQQLVSDHLSSESPQGENSQPESEKVVNTSVADAKKVDTPRDMRRNPKQSFPTWMMLLLVSIFGIIMALPLLQQ